MTTVRDDDYNNVTLTLIGKQYDTSVTVEASVGPHINDVLPVIRWFLAGLSFTEDTIDRVIHEW